MPSPHSTSIIILTINVALYVAMTVASSEARAAAWSLVFSEPVAGGLRRKIHPSHSWQRRVVAADHRGLPAWLGHLPHSPVNSWVLFDLILPEVEAFYGTSRLIAVYVFSTITGYLGEHDFLYPSSPSIGASRHVSA